MKINSVKKIKINRYSIYFSKVIEELKKRDNLESQTIYKAIVGATALKLIFEKDYKDLCKLSKKEACKTSALLIFFQEQLSMFLNLKEVDAKKYELTALYKASISNNSSKSTKNRRIDDVKNRSIHLKAVKDATIGAGQKLHKKLLRENSREKKYSFTQLCKDNRISRETGYKRLYSYYYSIYKKVGNKNKDLSYKEIINKVCMDEHIKEKDMVKAINKMGK